MEQQQDVPFMRSSATVRRKQSLQESHKSSSPEKAGPSFVDLLSSGPFTHEPNKSAFKVGVRSDLPEPSKLRTRAKKAGKMKRRRQSWDISEHIAQLKHKCLDFNWGKPTVEIKNKHKPEEAMATVRRCNLKPKTSDSMTSWVPSHVSVHTHGRTASSTSGLHLVDDTDEEIQRWDAGAGISHLASEDDEIPSYLHPPSKPSFHHQQQPKIAQIPDVPSFPENPFFQSYLDDDKNLTATSSFVPATSSDHNSRWDKFITQKEF
ncbi:uncharacterized protein LOC119745400 [Patiria miniata]|uniref:Uncharacterized protein n=1 Tax=Patiria miniata TaxID=46514 RepID=A0A914BNE2_PATMI|nr:uncharacterized protein LOC119745400 [Patiria miniata]